MKYSLKLKKMRAEAIGNAKAIVAKADNENRVMTAEEQADFDAQHAKAAEFRTQIEKAELQEREELALETPEPPKATVPAPSVEVPGAALPATPKYRGHLRNAPNVETAYRFGVWACAALGLNWATKKARDMFSPMAVLNEGTNTAGGYLVPEEFLNSMIDLREKYGIFRRKCKVVPMTRDTLVIPRRTSGLTAYPVGESAVGTESNKAWDTVTLTANKWMVITRMSSELSEDAVINIGDDLIGEISYAFANAEDTAGFNGDGTSTYSGITGLKNALQAGSIVTQGTSNTWAAIVMADFHSLLAKIPDYTLAPNPEFYCNKSFYHNVMERLALASGGVTSLEIVNGVAQGRFLGYPVNFATPILNATTNATITCYFGDLGAAAKFGDRRQVSIAMSDSASVGGQSMWERDQIGIKGTQRFDIVVHERGTASAAGPIVALKTGN